MTRSEIIIDPLTGSICKVVELVPKDAKVRYKQVRLGTRVAYVHKVIWEHVHGPVPKGMDIDHIDGNTHNNSIFNLRLLEHGQNCQNRHSAQAGSKTGIKGVSYDERGKKWKASISRQGKNLYLGRFTSVEEAKKAYADAAAIYHTHNPHASK